MQADVETSVKERLFGAEQSDAMLKQVVKARFLRELRQPTAGEDTDEQSGPSTEPRREPLPIAPVRIGHFAVLRKLGQGGMGVVYAAYDEQLDRKVAIKVLRRGLADDERGRARMLREAQALARLSHPNVVAVHEVGQWRDHDYVAMEFVAGRTLDAWLHERASVRPWREVLSVMIQAGRGLAAAHACELVHRDFKPANVMVGEEGRVRVLDFGLARSVHERDESAPVIELEQTLEHSITSQTSTSAFDRELTATGAVLGTPAYMALEQHQGQTATTLSDQFSFGVVLYEALYGERPFRGHSRAEYALRVSEGKVEVPARSGVPAWLRKAVLRTLAPNPADRWPSMDALLAELSRERGRGFKVGALVAGFAVLIVAGFAMNPSEPALCELGDDALAGVWDETQRASLQQAFAGEGHVLATVEARLDQQSDALLAARRDACEDRWVRAEQSDAQLALRSTCLDQRTRELRATVEQLTGGSRQSIEHAVELLDGLGDVGFCERVDLLEEGAPAPKDAETATKIASLRDRIADAHALRLASDLPKAWTIVDAIEKDVEQLGHGPLQAELAYLRGRLEQREERLEDARASLLAAATLSEEFGHVELAPAAWTYLLSVSHASGAPEQSSELAMARAALKRMRIPVEDRAWLVLDDALGHRLIAAGKPERAVSLLEQGLRRTGDDSPSTARARISASHQLALALAESGRLDEAARVYRETWQLAARTLGEETLPCADVDFDLGVLLLDSEDSTDEGLKYIERARATYLRLGAPASRLAMIDLARSNHALVHGKLELARQLANQALELLPVGHPDRSWVLDALVVIESSAGNVDAALEAANVAIRQHIEDGRAADPRLAFVMTQRGHVELTRENFDAALQDFELAAAIYEKTLAQEHPDWVHLHAGLGEARLRLGKIDDAADSFDRAAHMLSPNDSDHRVRANIAWGRARVAAARGDDEARVRLSLEALELLRTLDAQDTIRREIEASLR